MPLRARYHSEGVLCGLRMTSKGQCWIASSNMSESQKCTKSTIRASTPHLRTLPPHPWSQPPPLPPSPSTSTSERLSYPIIHPLLTSFKDLDKMASSSTIDIPSTLLQSVRKFRLTPSKVPISAQIFKIDKKSLTLQLEETLSTGLSSVEDLVEQLPENSPRFLIVNYKLQHHDGRVSYVRLPPPLIPLRQL